MSTGIASNLISVMCVLVAIFLPLEMAVFGVLVLALSQVFFSRAYHELVFLSCWVHWYLTQRLVPVLLPDPYNLTPLLCAPFVIGSLLVTFTSRREGVRLDVSWVIVYVIAQFFLQLVVSNRASSFLVSFFVPLFACLASLSLHYLGVPVYSYYLMAIAWVYVLPCDAVSFLLRFAYVLILARACYLKKRARKDAGLGEKAPVWRAILEGGKKEEEEEESGGGGMSKKKKAKPRSRAKLMERNEFKAAFEMHQKLRAEEDKLIMLEQQQQQSHVSHVGGGEMEKLVREKQNKIKLALSL